MINLCADIVSQVYRTLPFGLDNGSTCLVFFNILLQYNLSIASPTSDQVLISSL